MIGAEGRNNVLNMQPQAAMEKRTFSAGDGIASFCPASPARPQRWTLRSAAMVRGEPAGWVRMVKL
jgi:hypothetical protein